MRCLRRSLRDRLSPGSFRLLLGVLKFTSEVACCGGTLPVYSVLLRRTEAWECSESMAGGFKLPSGEVPAAVVSLRLDVMRLKSAASILVSELESNTKRTGSFG